MGDPVLNTTVAQRPSGGRGVAAITGAAGGLGSAFARELARRGWDLILSDRDAAGLEALAQELQRTHSVSVEKIAVDLATGGGRTSLQERVATVENLGMLINNAGFGTYALFHEADLATQVDMIQVHVTASVELCRAALPGMVGRGQGAIINVASAGAFTRFPRDATYIGTKSFLVAFTECLAIELVDTGVSVQALCPAWVDTAFSASGDYAKVEYKSPIPRWLFVSPAQVVESSLRVLGHGPVTHIPTLRARLAIILIGSRLGRMALAAVRRPRSRK